jgi:hypothetical protein
MWRLVIYYSKGYQMVCHFTICYKRNVERPYQGNNILMQFQTILPSTFFNKIEIQQQTHRVLQSSFH